jgi:hypothetical protein
MDSLLDTVFYPSVPTSIEYSLREGYGEGAVLYSGTMSNPAFSSVTSQGYAYSISLPITTPLVKQSGGMFPYQFHVKAYFSSGPADFLVKPVYVLTPLVGTHVNSLMRYLDKARIKELDPSLQYSPEEMVHFLIEGINYINSVGTPSMYTLDAMPPTLYSLLVYAAAFAALNARYLAEGMNSFEFTGANTQLSFNRKEVLQTKMSELQSMLDTQLPNAKKAAIVSFGPGTAPEAAIASGMTMRRKLGSIGLTVGPTTNSSRFLRYTKMNITPYRY